MSPLTLDLQTPTEPNSRNLRKLVLLVALGVYPLCPSGPLWQRFFSRRALQASEKLCRTFGRSNRLQPMPMRSQFPLPEQERKQHPEKSQNGENPHPQPISRRIASIGVAKIVGPSH